MADERRTRKIKDLGALHKLLLKAAPEGPEVDGKRATPSISTLAMALGMSHWAVYVWIKNKRVPARRVKRLVEIGEGRVTEGDFHPFTFV